MDKAALLKQMQIAPETAAFCEKQEPSLRAKFQELDEIA